MRKQRDIIKQLTDRELNVQLIISQFSLVFLSIILSYILFDSFVDWLNYFKLSYYDIVYYGAASGLLIVIIDLVFMYIFPKKYYDDGGINQRIFRDRSVGGIFLLALLVAIAEELLFRGVIQTTFGYLVASIVFALIHFRYLKKPVLFVSILFVSFYIGYIFVLTENLLVTIMAHFIIDFTLGLVIRFQKRGANNE
ncbi:CPBP family intramembrane glutamic endopeptidase [Virgibacillus necropolis]|uniref:CPBP family intramembrane metalloprotease n=1 Tax=Virgibacillus necropolis TaxID=163877 RepID=A0A221MCU9_9BACI|nr:type II CAAX endopeptidase family protein [Virgibacillus necropolis]ASN05485.1 CPBP family intramembrane metalloprotease [Virgibacillus necropolis]